MARAVSICLEHGCPHTVSRLGRCKEHAAERDRHQKRTTPTKMWEPRDRRRRARAVREHRRRFGNWCPGYRVPPHGSTDLTAQHVEAVADAGRGDGVIVVWCRSCNSRHGQEVAMRFR